MEGGRSKQRPYHPFRTGKPRPMRSGEMCCSAPPKQASAKKSGGKPPHSKMGWAQASGVPDCAGVESDGGLAWRDCGYKRNDDCARLTAAGTKSKPPATPSTEQERAEKKTA